MIEFDFGESPLLFSLFLFLSSLEVFAKLALTRKIWIFFQLERGPPRGGTKFVKFNYLVGLFISKISMGEVYAF